MFHNILNEYIDDSGDVLKVGNTFFGSNNYKHINSCNITDGAQTIGLQLWVKNDDAENYAIRIFDCDILFGDVYFVNVFLHVYDYISSIFCEYKTYVDSVDDFLDNLLRMNKDVTKAFGNRHRLI